MSGVGVRVGLGGWMGSEGTMLPCEPQETLEMIQENNDETSRNSIILN